MDCFCFRKTQSNKAFDITIILSKARCIWLFSYVTDIPFVLDFDEISMQNHVTGHLQMGEVSISQSYHQSSQLLHFFLAIDADLSAW